jgi:hypothetical protein
VAEAIAAARRTGERVYEAELTSMNGATQLMNAVSAPKAAEECFRQAMDLAHQQGARFWKLPTANRLALTLHKQNRRTEARSILADTYSFFTEGVDTVDLKEAKVLLDELSQ